MTSDRVAPLDPDSPKGKQIAAELTELLAEFRLAIAERRRRAAAEREAAAAPIAAVDDLIEPVGEDRSVVPGGGYAALMPIRWSSIHEQLGVTPRDLDFAMLSDAVDQHLVETESLDWKRAYPWAAEGSAETSAEGQGRKPPKDPGYEFAKDVAAMANTRGGLLVYGVSEERGSGSAKDFSSVDNSEAVRRRLRAFASARIRPVVSGLDVVPLTSDDGQKTVLVVSVPRSPDAPHMIGDGDHLGVPYRDGAETHWMREREIERAYRDRFGNQEDERRQLGELIADAANQLDMSGKAWIVAAARPQTPLPTISAPLVRDDVRSVLDATLRRAVEVVPANHLGRLLLVRELGSAALNPRVGLRRWVVRTTSTDNPEALSTLLHVELHHDGSIVFATTVDGWRTSEVKGVHRVFCPVIENFAVDFTAMVESHGIRTGGQGSTSYRLELRRCDEMPYEATDVMRLGGGHASNLEEVVGGSRHVYGFTPITGEIPLAGDVDGLRDAARGISTGVLHQFGVDRLTLFPRST